MGIRVDDTEPNVCVPEPNVLDSGNAGGNREPVDPIVEAPEEMVSIHANEHAHKPAKKQVKKKKLKPRSGKVDSVKAKKRFRGELRERGGASFLCPECGGATRVLATRRPDDENLRLVRRRRLCKNRKCKTVFITHETLNVYTDDENEDN